MEMIGIAPISFDLEPNIILIYYTSTVLRGFEPLSRAPKALEITDYSTELYIGLEGIKPTTLPSQGSVLSLNYKPTHQ